MVIPGAIRAVSSHHFISRPHASPESWPRRQWWSCSWLHWLLPILPPCNFTGDPATFFSETYLRDHHLQFSLFFTWLGGLCFFVLDLMGLNSRFSQNVYQNWLFHTLLAIGGLKGQPYTEDNFFAAESPLGIQLSCSRSKYNLHFSAGPFSALITLLIAGAGRVNHSMLWLHFNVRHTTCKTVSTELKLCRQLNLNRER